jgi:lipopolysaccharide export system permease protein
MKVIGTKPLLLYSYIATEMLAPFYASFLIINSILIIAKIIPFLDTVLEMQIGLNDFVRSFSYLFPNIFVNTIPVSVMMGSILCFIRMSNDLEILALKASGINIYQLLPPVIIVGLLLSILTSYCTIVLIPAGSNAMKKMMYQLTKEKIEKGIKEGQFTVALGDLVLYVNEIDKKTNKWKDVWVSDMRGVTTPMITMARSGQMIPDLNTKKITILLNNGSMHKAQDDKSQIISFAKYTLNIPIVPPKYVPGHQTTKTMTMNELKSTISEYGLDSKRGINSSIQYHKRIATPFGCLVFALLGLPLGLHSRPGKRNIGLPLGLFFFVIYYIVDESGKFMADEQILPVVYSMWLPNMVFCIITIYLIIRTANDKPFLSERVKNSISRLLPAK